MGDSIVEIDVEKPAAGGRMLARHRGQVVLVWGAIPGERVRARIERSGKGVLFAETVDVISPSPDRRDATADWRCGGNVLAHVRYERQLHLKSEIVRDAFARIGRMPLAEAPDVMGSPEQGYRMRARLHVRGSRVGFMREGSHDICPAGPTGQLLPATVAWIEAAEATVRSRHLSGLTSIEIAENIPGTERACHLELAPGSHATPFAVLGTGAITGLTAHVLDRHEIETLSGVGVVYDVIGDSGSNGALRLRRDARSFFQGNRFLLNALLERVTAHVAEGKVVDLYAGVGLFGLALAAAGAAGVTLIEGDPTSGHDLEENARPYADRAQVERTSVEDFLSRGAAPGDATFIVDPPRTGMSTDAVHAVVRSLPKRIVYVSCDVATLARDARVLVDGGFALVDISAVDLFPNTAHVETVAVFQRQ